MSKSRGRTCPPVPLETQSLFRLHFADTWNRFSHLHPKASPFPVKAVHMDVRRKISRRGKVDILLIFFRLLAIHRKWTYTKKKMFNVTAAVVYSVFYVRKLYTEQMFVVVSMDMLRLSKQSSEWNINFVNFWNKCKILWKYEQTTHLIQLASSRYRAC